MFPAKEKVRMGEKEVSRRKFLRVIIVTNRITIHGQYYPVSSLLNWNFKQKKIQSWKLLDYFSLQNGNTQEQEKLAAVARES